VGPKLVALLLWKMCVAVEEVLLDLLKRQDSVG
jgi:hypothetical protein